MELIFNPVSELAALTVPPPKAARNYLPQWYKDIPAFHTGKPEISVEGTSNRTAKMCVPFADSLTAGYIQETWQDISIEVVKTESGDWTVKYAYPTKPDIIGARNAVAGFSYGEEFHPVEFTFHPAWTPQLPDGWSMLYTHPLNRHDLPFQMLSGIVENDRFTHSDEKSNLPFYVKKSFSGVIPKGTPMVQMIPIKREEWTIKVEEYQKEYQMQQNHLMRQQFWGGYRKTFWEKKTYN